MLNYNIKNDKNFSEDLFIKAIQVAEKAHQNLGWKCELSLEEALRDAWKWQKFLITQ